MNKSFIQQLFLAHQECPDCPSIPEVSSFFTDLLSTLFPDFSQQRFSSADQLGLHMDELKLQLSQLLSKNKRKATIDYKATATGFFDQLPVIYEALYQDVSAMYTGDPAAKSPSEVIRSYPGFYAIAAYRLAHALHLLGVQTIPRMITEYAHSKTGIDIHPAAQIGTHFCIDHGTGVVIGETTIIGNYVKIYQGVTLGAVSVNKEDAARKRHPTLEDHVIVYAGATILGGDTTIGHHSVVGGNVWVTKSISPHTKVYYQAKMYNEASGDIDLVIFKEKA